MEERFIFRQRGSGVSMYAVASDDGMSLRLQGRSKVRANGPFYLSIKRTF